MADAAAPAVRTRATVPDLGTTAVGVAAALGMGALAAADGGYFAPSWGWTALVGFWLAAAWLLLGRAALPGGPAAVFVGAVAGLTGWTWLSLIWTENTVQTTLEGFRLLAYLAVAGALVLVVRRESTPALLRGLLAAITLVSTFGLATRLFPDRLGTFDPIATYRLSEPLGYWNGLGIFAAMGALLALGMLARDRSLVVRCLAGAAFTVLLVTQYFTFSRGAWIALGIGFLAAFVLDPRRLHLVVALLAVGAPAALAVWISSTSEALTHQDSPLSAAVEQGQEVALLVALLAAAAAAAVAGLAWAERRVTPQRTVRLAFAGAVALLAAAAVVGVVVRFGGPVELVEEAHDAFTATPPQGEVPADLGSRLFTFTGGYRAENWEAAWDDFRANPVLGSGPGTYEQYWNRNRPVPHIVQDAHSLYLEMLAELGPLGLALLLLALGVPLAAAVGARREPLAVGALGAYAAYLVHAGGDWDWELLGVTVPALACGTALLALRPARAAPLIPGPRIRIAGGVLAIVLAGVAFVGLVGSSAVASSEDAGQASPPDYEKAEDEARKARRWARWSSEPWLRLGEAQFDQGRVADARASYRRAIAKEPDDWFLWFRLAEASEGAEQERALAEASSLNPLSPEIAAFRQEQG